MRQAMEKSKHEICSVDEYEMHTMSREKKNEQPAEVESTTL